MIKFKNNKRFFTVTLYKPSETKNYLFGETYTTKPEILAETVIFDKNEKIDIVNISMRLPDNVKGYPVIAWSEIIK